MRVDLSSATTAISTPMSTATATPYSPGTLVSNEESTTERSQEQTSRGLPEASPSKNPNVRPLSLAVGTGDSGVMVGKRSVEFCNSVSFSESNEHNHLHAPGEQQRANILARWASMGQEQTPRGHANGDSLKDNPCLDRITARRVLLSSAQRGALSSADTSIGSPTATRERSGVPSDSSSSDSGPIRRMRTVTDASPAGLDKPEQATGVPETNGVGAADVLLRRAGASSDSRARMRTAGPNPLSPLHSPMHGQLRVHSAHGNGSTVVGTAGRGGRGIVAQRKLMIEARRSKAASAGDSSKTGRSWAPLVGSQASFDNLRQEAANCTRANVGINGNDEGGVGSGRSTSGESYHGGQQGEGRRVEPRKGAIAQFMVSRSRRTLAPMDELLSLASLPAASHSVCRSNGTCAVVVVY